MLTFSQGSFVATFCNFDCGPIYIYMLDFRMSSLNINSLHFTPAYLVVCLANYVQLMKNLEKFSVIFLVMQCLVTLVWFAVN